MNLIHIVVDTWGAHYHGCYGNTWIRTPGADGLAARSAVFTQAFAESLPTIPARRVIYTGRRAFPADLYEQPDDRLLWRGWHQLYREDVTLAETLQAAGYTTALVSDCYHQFKPGRNFHRGFASWQFVRGQENDKYASGPWGGIALPGYDIERYRAAGDGQAVQYLLNRRTWQGEEDWSAARTFRRAELWLEDNAGEDGPFYLHVESFSPHEFWDPPEDYYRLYAPAGYQGRRIFSPPQRADAFTPLELAHVRALFAGLVTFVDARLGLFLERVAELGLLENTLIVFTADHGTMQGEQGQIGKGEGGLRTQLTRVPLFFHSPGGAWAGRRIAGLVQHTDIMPTVLDVLGVPAPARVTGESLRPLIEAGGASTREWIVTGWNDHGALRTSDWLYQGRWNEGEAFEELYDLRRDPLELTNVIASYPQVVRELRGRLLEYVNAGWATTRGTL